MKYTCVNMFLYVTLDLNFAVLAFFLFVCVSCYRLCVGHPYSVHVYTLSCR